MNILSFHCIEENGLSFALLIDGRPLGELVGAANWAIPYWDVEDDLPYLPPRGPRPDPEMRIVCCCACGEYGCTHTRCRVVHEANEVVLRDFDLDASLEGKKRVFRFSLANYREVVSAIVERSREMPTNS